MKLREWRAAKGLTLKDAANLLGVSVSGLSDLERGQYWPQVELIVKIEGVTQGDVDVADHFAAWRAAHPQEFSAFREAGRRLLKAFVWPAKAKGPTNG